MKLYISHDTRPFLSMQRGGTTEGNRERMIITMVCFVSFIIMNTPAEALSFIMNFSAGYLTEKSYNRKRIQIQMKLLEKEYTEMVSFP